MHVTKFLLTASMMFSFAIAAEAQQIATRDLRRTITVTDLPTEKKNEEPKLPNGCEHMGMGFADGFTMNKDGKPRQIKLKLVDISATKLAMNSEVTATISLQNAGPSPIQIPWSTDFQTTMAGQDPENRTWEFGQFQLALGQGDKHYYDELISTSLPLYGSEFVPNSMLTIKPGEWITAQITFLVSVVRPQFESIKIGPADLTVEWFQTRRTHVLKDCGITFGYFPYDSFYRHVNRVTVRRVQIGTRK